MVGDKAHVSSRAPHPRELASTRRAGSDESRRPEYAGPGRADKPRQCAFEILVLLYPERDTQARGSESPLGGD
jgi:hypothetical protein